MNKRHNNLNVRARATAALLALAALLGSCSSDDGDEAVSWSDQAVSFSTSATNVATRTAATPAANAATTRATAGVINGEAGLRALPEGFGVFGYMTDRSRWTTAKGTYDATDPGSGYPRPDFMLNQPVTWAVHHVVWEGETPINGYDWTYSPLKYWPNTTENLESRFVSFFAYAPFIEQADMQSTGITAMTGDADRSPFIAYTMGEPGQMVDLLWAYCTDATRNGQGLIEVTADGTVSRYQRVPLNFQHALACVDIYVQRVYDEPTYSGKPGDSESSESSELSKLFVNRLQLKASDVIAGKGRLSLETGDWTATDGRTGNKDKDSCIVFLEDDLDTPVRGTATTSSTAATPTADALALIREHELSKWGQAATGVSTEERPLVPLAQSLIIMPQTLTLRPTVSYTMVKQDNSLITSYVTDVAGNRYARVMQEQTGNPSTVKFEANKRYRLVIHIGVQHVSFEVVSVVDWDFPLRANPSVVGSYTNEEVPHTLNEK